ncbi:Hydroxysteroid dehydrogenase-like protein 2 [Larimichthys crocea]|uniref:Hydroxysteroid dehydrogenase-like protein 2 n=1 Tax=Larimichthys crocea TaxID=215358 RepID=A0A6G0I2J5_LARCR|nr:hydroxysteroid dehydrogenase-like protein 2 [Larimichthys crocea]KAE8285567.1 Hydroxysteroid dehydrogenase-like protein 2 [Larimichthys crocea]TMS01121.1 Hydroxysteroid dehydrogenase-like protein 2 [Larimichthys crocea]
MLQNTGKLAGCTLFITGGSRGIGKAIALKAARDGANVVIAAKTAVPHPKLPGTIYSAAQEVEAAGGKALACVVDIRDEQQIGEAVQKAVDKFGGIDILVNNASAISLTGTLETPMKKVDLMLGINLRGTYLTSKLVIPHLLKSRSPHILNLAPPLNLNPIWFKNHTAYTMAKYGMSMCVLGMSEEFRGQIAVNALWPKTAIQTAAMSMLGGEDIGKQCRTADIMADAAYAILSQPKDYTGHFLVDEDVLKEQGVHDFDQYAVQPGHPLLPDYFLDSALEKMPELHETTKPPTDTPTSSGPIGSTFDAIKGAINEDVVKSTQGIYQFNLSGEHEGVWFLDLKSGSGSTGQGQPPVKADVVMTMDSTVFSKMFAGKLKPTLAFMSGKLQIRGDMTLALKLEKLMNRMNKAKL